MKHPKYTVVFVPHSIYCKFQIMSHHLVTDSYGHQTVQSSMVFTSDSLQETMDQFVLWVHEPIVLAKSSESFEIEDIREKP